jgi:hypothetical protein
MKNLEIKYVGWCHECKCLEVLFVVTVSLMRNTALVDLLNLCLRTNTVG